jgi:hypothetical protein
MLDHPVGMIFLPTGGGMAIAGSAATGTSARGAVEIAVWTPSPARARTE